MKSEAGRTSSHRECDAGTLPETNIPPVNGDLYKEGRKRIITFTMHSLNYYTLYIKTFP
jgi:hypothetical protein